MKRKKILAFLAAVLVGSILFSLIGFAAETINYTRLIKRVEPKIQTPVAVGETVTLRALAHKNAEVYATVNTEQVKLSRTAQTSGSFVWYKGSYRVSKDLPEGADLGTILFTAVKDGISERMTAPGLFVLESALQGDKEAIEAVSGQRVQVTADYADVFTDDDREEDYAAPYYFELPKGTIDYIAEVRSSTYLLKSGRKVLHSDVKVLNSTASMGNNTISDLEVDKDSDFTTLSIENKWNVPFNIESKPFTYKDKTNTVSSYQANKVVITFDYTTSVPDEKISLPRNSAFSDAKWSTTTKKGIAQAVLTLTLSEDAKYYGCYAEYDDGLLTLRFYNPIDDLSDARIVIDPGHGNFGGKNPDRGTIQDGLYESDLNLAKAEALRDELEKRGATVYMLDSDGTNLKDLYQRVDLAREWEPHIFISVHHNSTTASTTSARGAEVYYNTPFSQPLAKAVADGIFDAYREMEHSGNAVNRGDRFSEFCVTRVKQFAAILIEYGFMNNPEELGILTNEDNLELFAEHTADAIEKYFE